MLLTGCTADEGHEAFTFTTTDAALAYAEKRGLDGAADALRDGQVSAEEYRELFEEQLDCMRGLGYRFDEVFTDPIRGLQLKAEMTYIPGDDGEDVSQETADATWACQDQVDPVSQTYQFTNTPRMDDRLAAFVIECAAGKGVDLPEGGLNTEHLKVALADAEVGVLSECVHVGMRTLFPEDSSFGF